MVQNIAVLAGGASAKGINKDWLYQNYFVIGVNDSAIYAPVHVALTMDRTWWENRHQKIKDLGIPAYVRKEANINVKADWPNIYECDRKSNVMRNYSGLNGLNSGFCALNLAYRMNPARVLLCGFDMKPGYWYPAYEWQPQRGVTSDFAYKQWREGFEIIKTQFEEKGIEWTAA